MTHTQIIIKSAEYCYENRPCNYKDTENYRNKREFARALADNSGMKPTRALVDAIVKVINKNE